MDKARFLSRVLRPDERPKVVYEYYVTGNGAFPTDMLRYDAAWPATGEDAFKMIDLDNKRSIKFYSYRVPTIERWASFLWSVGTEKLH